MVLFISLIDLNSQYLYLFVFEASKNNFSNLSEITVMSLAFPVYVSGFEQVSAFKEMSYVKVSNLYKWWMFTLQIIFFFFVWVLVTIR